MKRPLNFLAAIAIAAATSFPSAAGADEKDVIEYRQHIMKSMNEQAAILGQIVSMSIPNENVITHLEVLALLASTALESFEPVVPGGEATPEVWENWDDFSQRMIEFAENSRQAVESAKQNGKDTALANILDVLSCKTCHDVYREEP